MCYAYKYYKIICHLGGFLKTGQFSEKRERDHCNNHYYCILLISSLVVSISSSESMTGSGFSADSGIFSSIHLRGSSSSAFLAILQFHEFFLLIFKLIFYYYVLYVFFREIPYLPFSSPDP